MFAIFLILGTISVLLLMLHWYQTRSHFAKLLNSFPGPYTPPLIGHPIQYSRKPEVLFSQARRLLGSYNETFRVWSANYGGLQIVTADDAEIILSSMRHIDKGLIYEFLLPWLGTGLLTSTGSKWQHRRKILTPTFHFNILHRFVEIFGEHSDKVIQKLKERQKEFEIDIVPLVTSLTLDVICVIFECTALRTETYRFCSLNTETAMGTKLNQKDKKQDKYLNALHKMPPLIVYRALSPWLYSEKIFNLIPIGWAHNKYVSIMHKFTTYVIKEREKEFKDEDVANLEDFDDFSRRSRKRLAMLDLLISAKNHRNEIDDEGIREEVDTFMFEGHDTTSVGICNILVTLAQHDDIQNKIIAELDEIFGSSKRTATYDDLQEMNYTEMCIKECLRLYPSVPLVSRILKEDTRLTHHTAPAGTIIVIHIYNIHRDPKYFPDPEKFDPNRFLPENSKNRHPYAYIPFSAGPRNCIGQKFAMLELKSTVSSILRNFKIEPVNSNHVWLMDFVLRKKGPINIRFKARDGI